MLTWIKMLPMELDSVTELLDPAVPIGPGETAIGPVSDDIKKLYTLWKMKVKQALQYGLDAEFARTDRERKEIRLLSLESQERASCLEFLFWIALKDELDCWKHPGTVGIRAGFIAVISEQKFPGLLDMLFGKR